MLTRWGLPLGLIVSGLLLSAFVFFAKLPAPARIVTARTAAAFLGTPLIAVAVLLTLRGATRARAAADRSADLVIVWIVTFLFGLHAAILATIIGLVPSLRAVVPHAAAVLLMGLGPTVATLSPGSPLGIRTSGTLADADLWRRTHRLTGWLLALSGACGLVGAQVGGPWALVMGVGPAVTALIAGLIYGSQPAASRANEDLANRERPSGETSVDATDA